MKKRVLVATLLILLSGAAGVLLWYRMFRNAGGGKTDGATVFVDSVAMLAGLEGNGMVNRFTGVVEAQRTVGVQVSYGLKVKETYVTVGQEVKVGTKLFSYDMDEAQDSITQLEIDIENYDIEIEATKAQIAQYEKERSLVTSETEKRAYTTSIMAAENSIRRAEYNKKSKQAEMENFKEQVANADVRSELQGVVQAINQANSGNDSTYQEGGYSDPTDENANAYITIMATGEYRIKGKVNEQNMQQIYEGLEMIVHSRVDESVTWHGMISEIDMDNTVQDNNGYYYGGDAEGGETSSFYPFYIELDDSTGLMLGQHVYAEPDLGQGEERTGIWLDAYYLLTDENGEVLPYVWAAKNDRLEKREVTLGEYDEDLMQYEIVAGLTADDYIALPSEELAEGMPVTQNIDQMGGVYEGDLAEDGAIGGDVYEDGMLEDGGVYEGDLAEDGAIGGDVYEDGMLEDGGVYEGDLAEDGALGGDAYEDGMLEDGGVYEGDLAEDGAIGGDVYEDGMLEDGGVAEVGA